MDAEKPFDKIWQPFILKMLSKLGMEENSISWWVVSIKNLKETLSKLTFNEAFPLKSEIDKGAPLSPLFVEYYVGILVNAVKKLEEIRGIRIWKEEVKWHNLQQ